MQNRTHGIVFTRELDRTVASPYLLFEEDPKEVLREKGLKVDAPLVLAVSNAAGDRVATDIDLRDFSDQKYADAVEAGRAAVSITYNGSERIFLLGKTYLADTPFYAFCFGQFPGLVGRAPSPAGVVHQPDLQADVQRLGVRASLLAQSPRDPEPVDTVHPGKMTGDVAGFIRLDGADKMPADIQLAEQLNFLYCLLHIAFAKIPLPCRVGLADGIGRVGFAHGQ